MGDCSPVGGAARPPRARPRLIANLDEKSLNEVMNSVPRPSTDSQLIACLQILGSTIE
jgi:hypothetical protein